jgi:hypothetical protein
MRHFYTVYTVLNRFKSAKKKEKHLYSIHAIYYVDVLVSFRQALRLYFLSSCSSTVLNTSLQCINRNIAQITIERTNSNYFAKLE